MPLAHRLADLHLVLGKGRGRQHGELLRHRQRVLQQFTRLRHLVDEAARERRVGVVGGAAIRDFRQIARRHRGTHDLEGKGRKRHAHRQFGDADAPALTRHDAAVGATSEHAAAGYRMPVDRRHHRLGMKEHGVEQLVQHGQEFADIAGAAFAEADEIDAGGKHLALPGHHNGLGVGRAQLVEARGNRLTKLDIERIDLAVLQGHHRDAVDGRYLDHDAAPAAAGFGASKLERCHSRSACTTAMVNTRIAAI